MSESVIEFIESLPVEITAPFGIFIFLCCSCIFKDCIICCYRERRANQRIVTLKRMRQETAEMDMIHSISMETLDKQPPQKKRRIDGSWV